MVVQQRILQNITIINWIFFICISVISFILSSPKFFLGIFLGGILVNFNFLLLRRTLKKSLTPPHLAPVSKILIKYYLRFIASGIIISVLILKNYVDPLGLTIGLSVLVASIMCTAFYEFARQFVKEAV